MSGDHCFMKGCSEPCQNRVPQPCGVGERIRHRDSSTGNGRGLHGGDDCVGDDYEKKDCNVLLEAQQQVANQQALIEKIQACASNCNVFADCDEPDVLPNKCG